MNLPRPGVGSKRIGVSRSTTNANLARKVQAGAEILCLATQIRRAERRRVVLHPNKEAARGDPVLSGLGKSRVGRALGTRKWRTARERGYYYVAFRMPSRVRLGDVRYPMLVRERFYEMNMHNRVRGMRRDADGVPA